jgi:hypothetical protein
MPSLLIKVSQTDKTRVIISKTGALNIVHQLKGKYQI